MAEHNDLGRKGEDIASNYLLEKGYKICERNWICNKNEVDIIAIDAECIVFVEVKTRASEEWGDPVDAISKKKMNNLIVAANDYIEQTDTELSPRFDIIFIILNSKTVQIEHIDDAFYPPIN